MGRRLRVEADGGSRGNPGPAGYGAVVKDAATGEVLAEVAESIGRATNNVAEYRGLVAGLRAAQAVDPEASVEVRMDSKLVVEQMSGRWQVKHADMRALAQEARSLVRPGLVDFGWIPRAQNSHADRLANEAMDAAAAGRAWQRAGASGTASPAAAAPPAAEADPDAPPTVLVLVRHGSTALTEQRRVSGRYGEDPELSDRGRAEAAAAATCWDVQDADVVVTSTLRRSQQTARIIAEALGADVVVDPQWDETDFGEWDGLTAGEVVKRWPREFAAWNDSPEAAPPGGESIATVERRVLAARDDLLRRWAGRRVVLVSHGDPLRVLLRSVLGVDGRMQRRIHVDPGSRTLLRYRADGTGEVLAVNRV
ncbi:putative phosphoglycerate mutase [Kineococcus radiotolerans]|uniref:Phosphoglycerate mutase n=2 Tax=Kineococcus radiotolerans TaxID=131568 RepID=A6WDA9_KINRD|nr:bifunctional RNase H/acid phosphatase [Kineococcus radiotolerans]ABS04798.1 Phosphoglycerate mutase [Kineococcus radiotolerans SRS30216 = ATCC BAA-149]MBB2901641.1 putative phosphoglycerate mutase [Kineococcus radiotolerans]